MDRKWEAEKYSLSKITIGFLPKRMAVRDATGGEIGYTSPTVGICIAKEHEIFSMLQSDEKRFFRKGVFAHELLHQIFTDFKYHEKVSKSLKSYEKPIFQLIANILEDPAIEYWAKTKFGGSLLKSLKFSIAHIYEQSPSISESKSAFSQFVNAFIQFGDMGLVKGEFTFPEAKEAFLELAPLFNDGILEPSGKKRLDIAKEIMDKSRFLWEEDAKREEEMKEFLKSLMSGSGKSEMSGSGSGEDGDTDSAPEAGDKGERRRKVIVKLSPPPSPSDSDSSDSDSSTSPSSSSSSSETGKEKGTEEEKKEKGKKGKKGADSEKAVDSEEGVSSSSSDSESSSSTLSSSPESSTSSLEESKKEDETRENSSSTSSSEKKEKKKEEKEEKESDSLLSSSDSSSKEKEDKTEKGEKETDEKEIEIEEESEEETEEETSSSSDDDSSASDSDSSTPTPTPSETEEESEEEILSKDKEITEEEKEEMEREIEKAEEEMRREEEEEKRDTSEIMSMDITEGGLRIPSSRIINERVLPGTDAATYSAIVRTMSTGIANTSRQIKKMISFAQEETEYATKGKINVRRLNCGKNTARVFDRKRVPNEIADLIVGVAVDLSGSMYGDRIANARKCCIALAEVCDSLNIPVYIMGFTGQTGYGEQLYHKHYITWKNSKADRMSLLNIQAIAQNLDGPSFRYFTEIMRKKQSKHKLMIVVSDGAPCAYGYAGEKANHDTTLAIKNARKICDVLGVAVGDSSTEVLHSFYGNDFLHVSQPSDLFAGISNKLKKFVRKWIEEE